MSTLSALKAQIATDLARSDLTSEIAAAITAAIEFYKSKQFHFNQSNSATFATVAAQSAYGSGDDADIPLFIRIDNVYLTDGSVEYRLRQYQYDRMRLLLDSGSSSGRPFAWSYYNQKFYLYAIPDAAYTVTPIGLIEVAAPASDAETGNVWMTEAYELLRCRAKAYLYLHTIHNREKALDMQFAEDQALMALRENTARMRHDGGRIESTQF